MPNIPTKPLWLRVDSAFKTLETADVTDPAGADSNIIPGVILAEEGAMRDGRGILTANSIRNMGKVEVPEKGLKSRVTHPNGTSDGFGRFLGRHRNLRVQELSNGRLAFVGDLHIDDAADHSYEGRVATYVKQRTKSDPDSFGASLVADWRYYNDEGQEISQEDMLAAFQEQRKTGKQNKTVWVPKKLHAADIVDTPNATNSFLALETMTDFRGQEAALATGALDQVFARATRETVEARCMAFLERYLDRRFGEVQMITDQLTTGVPGKAGVPAQSQPAAATPDVGTEARKPPAVPVIKEEPDAHAAVPSPADPVGNAVRQETQRVKAITQLAAIANLTHQQLNDLLSHEPPLSVTEATAKVAALSTQDNAMIPGGLPPKTDPDAELRKKFASQSDVYEDLGVTFDSYKMSVDKDKRHKFDFDEDK